MTWQLFFFLIFRFRKFYLRIAHSSRDSCFALILHYIYINFLYFHVFFFFTRDESRMFILLYSRYRRFVRKYVRSTSFVYECFLYCNEKRFFSRSFCFFFTSRRRYDVFSTYFNLLSIFREYCIEFETIFSLLMMWFFFRNFITIVFRFLIVITTCSRRSTTH